MQDQHVTLHRQCMTNTGNRDVHLPSFRHAAAALLVPPGATAAGAVSKTCMQAQPTLFETNQSSATEADGTKTSTAQQGIIITSCPVTPGRTPERENGGSCIIPRAMQLMRCNTGRCAPRPPPPGMPCTQQPIPLAPPPLQPPRACHLRPQQLRPSPVRIIIRRRCGKPGRDRRRR